MWIAPPEDIARISQFERHDEPRIRARYPYEPGGAGAFRALASVRSKFARSSAERTARTVPAVRPLKVDEGQAV